MTNTERVTLRPGDYTNITGCDQWQVDRLRDAFVAAGARDDGGCGAEEPGNLGWDARDNEVWSYPGMADGFRGRNLTRSQVLNATNAGAKEKKMTPAQRAGWKVGDRGVVKEGGYPWSKGSAVEFYYDDGTKIPKFKLISGWCRWNHAGGKPGAVLDLDNVYHGEPNPTATILREIADVLDAGGDPVEEFEHRGEVGSWHNPDTLCDLVASISDKNWQIRRKPKTVRVSGEVSHEEIDSATHILEAQIGGHAETVAQALLDCVEYGND